MSLYNMLLWPLLGLGLFASLVPLSFASPHSVWDTSTASCLRRPAFLRRLKPQGDVFLEMDLNGPVLRWHAQDGPHTYQPANWLIAGNTAGYTLDREGNIYLFPTPYISLTRNPPKKQNNLYWISSRTGLMSLYLKLPWQAPPTTANPFGIMGLAYDCDTHSLYVSSVAGSTYDREAGRIYQIDLAQRTLRTTLDGIDAFGLAVAIGPDGKRLYMGSARRSDVLSVPLDAQGRFQGQPRLEFRLTDAGGRPDERAMSIRFPHPHQMEIQSAPFFYSLRVSYNIPGRTYVYQYDPQIQQWKLKWTQQRIAP